ncbi:DNA/RNA helicase [Paenibacillus guangzhouensis]|uniref:DNA/RNA helicase n=1 Tax=Paenibacillus guangzhouensis TaxID=1473112 RepID=UPI0012675B64|nr:DNA/RNA helicase [Paenibacillus guangzhouensis]
MQHSAISFQFRDSHSARLAFDTMQELGYEPRIDNAVGTQLHIHVEHADLTSALEIAQAYGGELQAQAEMTEMAVHDEAYGLDHLIPVPAHVVNEDWVDGYADREAFRDADQYNNLDLRDEDHLAWVDETTDHFSGEVKA